MLFAKNNLRILLVGMICGFFHPSLLAQTSSATGRIEVTIQDYFNGLIRDATVELYSNNKKVTEQRSDSNGIAVFSNIPKGHYKLIIKAVGFEDLIEEQINVQNKKVLISVVLQVSSIKSDVEVDDAAADLTSFGATRSLTQTEIDSLPEDPEELAAALKKIAGLTPSGKDSQINVNGFNDSQLPPKEAIRKIIINQDYYSAKYDTDSGGGIDIFTKAGSEKFSGTVGFGFGDSRLNATNAFSGLRVPYSHQYGWTFLRGPITKKSSFSLYFRPGRSTSEAVINARILNPLLQPIDYDTSISQQSNSTRANARLDYDITEKLKLYASLEYGRTRWKNFGVGGFDLESMAYDTSEEPATFQIASTAFLNGGLTNQTRVEYRALSKDNISRNNGVTTVVQDAFTAGGAQNNSFTKSHRFEVSNDTIWQKDGHSFYFGGRFRYVSINEDSTNNFGGRYIFNGAVAPELDENDHPILDEDGDIVFTSITSLESYRRTRLFLSLGYSPERVRELGGGAVQFLMNNGEPYSHIDQSDAAFYFQHGFNLRNDLFINYGLRYEVQTNIKDRANFAPRFGLIWSPEVTRQTKSPLRSWPKISAGIGIFYERVNEDLTLRALQSRSKFQYQITDPIMLNAYPEIPELDDSQEFNRSRVTKELDGALASPYQTLVSVNIEKRMPFGSMFAVNLSYSQMDRALLLRNVNAPFAGDYPLGQDSGIVLQTRSRGQVKSKTLWFLAKFPKIKFTDLQIIYTYKTKKDNLVSGSSSPSDPYDFHNEFSYSDDDVRHNFMVILVNSLPFGIRLTNAIEARSGTPFNITTGRDTNGDTFFLERPSIASDMSKPGLIYSSLGVFDPNPLPGDRIIGRNSGRGHASFGIDTIINKQFKIGHGNGNNVPKYRFSISTKISNLLNIVNKSNPVGNLLSPDFLESNSYQPRRGFVTTSQPRSISFDMNFQF